MNLRRQIKVSSLCVRNVIKNTPQLIIESSATFITRSLGRKKAADNSELVAPLTRRRASP